MALCQSNVQNVLSEHCSSRFTRPLEAAQVLVERLGHDKGASGDASEGPGPSSTTESGDPKVEAKVGKPLIPLFEGGILWGGSEAVMVAVVMQMLIA